MEIKRKLVGSRAEMIAWLTEARDAVVAFDAEIEGKRDDTRIKRAERKGYHDGLDFAVKALTDWEPRENDSDTTGEEPLSGVSRPTAGSAASPPGPLRNPSGGNPPSASR